MILKDEIRSHFQLMVITKLDRYATVLKINVWIKRIKTSER